MPIVSFDEPSLTSAPVLIVASTELARTKPWKSQTDNARLSALRAAKGLVYLNSADHFACRQAPERPLGHEQ
jgi:hypothetical protein